ncbi:MAG TPA: serine hydrolase [Allosphingosinicella sp.]|nr:serine hydrolase [Allosphingosinicella sp.]
MQRPGHCLLPAVLAAALLLPAPAAGAQAPTVTATVPSPEADRRLVRDLEAFIGEALARLPTIPALSVAVSRSGGPLFVRGFGRADVEAGVPADADTRFYIASSTKSFVSLALALLEERGVIDLDWTLAELAPDVRFAPDIRAGEVTLQHLLSHTHGLLDEPIVFRLGLSGEHDQATLWRLLGRLEPNSGAPFGTFRYGNIGYNLATLLIERRLGRPWQDIVEREVFVPLGLRQTLTRGLERARTRARFAAPYTSLGPNSPVRRYLIRHDDTMQSGGGIYSSAKDMARWLRFNLSASRGGETALPAAVGAATHRPVVTMNQRFAMFRRAGYGLGWYSGDYHGDTLVHSFGAFTGARAHVSFIPTRDIGVAVLTNDEGAGFILTDVVAAYVYDWLREGPEAAGRTGRERIAEIAAQVEASIAQIAAEQARIAGRHWRLTLPPAAYGGRYCHPDYGTLTIAEENGALIVRVGRLRGTGQPLEMTDAMRIELVPGDGGVLRFVATDGRVVAVQALGSEFRRCA